MKVRVLQPLHPAPDTTKNLFVHNRKPLEERTMSRERISAQQTETTAAEQEQELTLAASHVVSDVSEVDDLLDEIDGLLAENAEDFVTGFVQKGGE